MNTRFLPGKSNARRAALAREAASIVHRFILKTYDPPEAAFDDAILGLLQAVLKRRRADAKIFGGAQ
jgi:hypothetical protein